MRALALSIFLLFGCQKPIGITNSTDLKIDLEDITNSIGMKLVLIPPGTFTRVSLVGEFGRLSNKPPQEVTLTTSYFLGVYEVTQDQYEKVMGSNPSYFKGAKNSVETVSWDDAVSFCKKLSEMPEEKAAGREYRLPTEAEWEYACRAGSTTSYSFGETAESLGEYAWFASGSAGKTHPVGEKKANRWGLYDMHGNVREWCQDRFGTYPSGASTDPQGPNGDQGGGSTTVGSQLRMSPYPYRVYRSGSWFTPAGYCRSALRAGTPPSFRSFDHGFRIALSPSGIPK
jgi:formylglycine-generating enzyme required for sulfatase activity